MKNFSKNRQRKKIVSNENLGGNQAVDIGAVLFWFSWGRLDCLMSVANLFHCLGAGQALKYAPVFGELIADLVTKVDTQYPDINISEFSLTRFYDKPISEFWETDTDNSNSL